MMGAIERAHHSLKNHDEETPISRRGNVTGAETLDSKVCRDAGHSYEYADQKWSVARLRALLKLLDPEEGGRPTWIAIGMALHNVLNGSEEGLYLFDTWSASGATYPGRPAIEAQWRSFNSNAGNRYNLGTILKRVAAANHDWMAVCSETDDPFEPCEMVVEIDGNDSAGKAYAPAGTETPLDRYSLRGMSDELAKEAGDQVPFLDGIANMGQATAIFAKPNSGKTLLVMSGLCKDISEGRLRASAVYYVNVDDSAKGLADKVALADEHGFHMLSEGYNGFGAGHLLEIIRKMVEIDQARGIVIILDTVKKFTNVMDKTKASQFTQIIRRFVLKGGTIIALAHTNKNPGADGKPVYGGTSDIVDDFDCAYTIRESPSRVSNEKVVLFENIKQRGNNPSCLGYRYSIESEQSYAALLSSVERIDDDDTTPARRSTKENDNALISAIETSINDGVTSKMKLAAAASKITGQSKRLAINVIERYTGDDPAAHRWHFVIRDRGAKVFALLDRNPMPNSTPT